MLLLSPFGDCCFSYSCIELCKIMPYVYGVCFWNLFVLICLHKDFVIIKVLLLNETCISFEVLTNHMKLILRSLCHLLSGLELLDWELCMIGEKAH